MAIKIEKLARAAKHQFYSSQTTTNMKNGGKETLLFIGHPS